jgi:hypothetical protein
MTPELIDSLVAAAADMALAFVDLPEDQMLILLWHTRKQLTFALSETLGTHVATLAAEAFVATVMRRRAAIERPYLRSSTRPRRRAAITGE